MGKENWTEGDWRTNERPNGKLSITAHDGHQVCLMWNCKERDANANLITAAPDLYEALKLAVDECGVTPDGVGKHGGEYHIILTEDEVNKMRKAITKARGGVSDA